MKIMRDATFEKALEDARESGERRVTEYLLALHTDLPKTSTEKRNLLRGIIKFFEPDRIIPESKPRSTRVTSEEHAAVVGESAAEAMIEPR